MSVLPLPALPLTVPADGLAPPTTLRAVVRQFTPNWFTVTMGTGVLALALPQLPGAGAGAVAVGAGLWMLAAGLFVVFVLLYAARWLLYPAEARRILRHPVMSMFLGAIPMALATVVNGLVVFGPGLIGPAAIGMALGLWWATAALALICGLAVPYLMFTRQAHSLERMTAVWLLPIVAAEVAAVSAAVLAPHLAQADAVALIVAGTVMWACSVPLAMSVLVVLFLRLALHKLPEQEVGPSAWLALGPVATGALGLMLLGAAAQTVLAGGPFAMLGEVARGVGLIGGLMFWGYGLWWLGLALLKTGRYLREGLPFSLGWWAFTFPLGVYALATLALGRMTTLPVFDLLGTGLVAVLALLWAVVAARTVAGVRRRTLFVAPCLVAAA